MCKMNLGVNFKLHYKVSMSRKEICAGIIPTALWLYSVTRALIKGKSQLVDNRAATLLSMQTTDLKGPMMGVHDGGP